MKRSWAGARRRWARFASPHPERGTWLPPERSQKGLGTRKGFSSYGTRRDAPSGYEPKTSANMGHLRGDRAPRGPDAWRPRARQPITRRALAFLVIAVLLAIPGEGKKAKSRSGTQDLGSTQCERQAKAAAPAAAGGTAQEYLQAAIALSE